MHVVTVPGAIGSGRSESAGDRAVVRRPATLLQWALAGAPCVLGILCIIVYLNAVGTVLIAVGAALLLTLWLYGHPGGTGGQSRPEARTVGDEAVAEALRAFDDRYYLLQAVDVRLSGGYARIDYVLVGPRGVFALDTDMRAGTIMYAGGSWLAVDPDDPNKKPRVIGDPTTRVQRGASLLRQYIRERLEAVPRALPLVPLVVFIHPGATLDVVDAPGRVVGLHNLATVLRLYPHVPLMDRETERIVGLLSGTKPIATGAAPEDTLTP